MVTDEELKIMYIRKHAAESALRFFRDIKSVKSTNSFLPWNCASVEDQYLIKSYRKHNPYTIRNRMWLATMTGVGNCIEKSAICYCSLFANPLIINNSVVTLVRISHLDHAFVIISDAPMEVGQLFLINDLDQTTLIVDGWTEDWHFPNLDLFTAIINNLARFASPVQCAVRAKINFSELFKASTIL
ncbi:MAG: hypothetical protein KAH18_07715 [Psychromonas sp.]|nr:hypothetical protein [Psychromonas sp.]